jgi:hypothetical protein
MVSAPDTWEEYQRVLKLTGFTNHHWGISTDAWAALATEDRRERIEHLVGHALLKTGGPPAPVPAGWGDW